jgi:hypothetical protein
MCTLSQLGCECESFAVEGVAEPGIVVEVVRAEHEGLTLLRSCTVTESSWAARWWRSPRVTWCPPRRRSCGWLATSSGWRAARWWSWRRRRVLHRTKKQNTCHPPAPSRPPARRPRQQQPTNGAAASSSMPPRPWFPSSPTTPPIYPPLEGMRPGVKLAHRYVDG